jgi:hypothetical protein
MNFREYYRPKLPRNKYGALSRNHLTRNTTSMAYSLRSIEPSIAEPIELNFVFPVTEPTEITEIEEGEIVIETEAE